MANETGIVIVGGGQSGGNAAFALRGGGYAGPVTIIGEEPHIPYERPPLSKGLLVGESEIADTYINTAEAYAEQDITLRLETHAQSIDRAGGAVLLGDGAALAYDKLMLATGARVRRLDLPGGDLAGVHYLRDIADSLAIREHAAPGRHVLVIGGGYIGLEVAASATKLGATVTVVEVAPLLVNRVVAPDMSAYFRDLHERHDVTVLTEMTVEAIEGEGRVREVLLADGERLATDIVVIGIGVVPNTELAAEAGLALDNGVRVDEFGRTDDDRIFAAGDVTNHFNPLLGRHVRLESWQNAQNQAIAVAQVMLGGETPYAEIPWFWSDQYDINLQITGAPERWDALIRRAGEAEGSFTLFYLEGGVLVGANAINNPRDIRPARRMIAEKKPVRADELADPGVKLADLAKH